MQKKITKSNRSRVLRHTRCQKAADVFFCFGHSEAFILSFFPLLCVSRLVREVEKCCC